MNKVFEKTRELGVALMESDEYMEMKRAETKAMGNEEAAMTMGQYLEKKSELEKLLSQPDSDPKQIADYSQAMDELSARMQLIDDITALNGARESFSNLIEQVNQVLRFIITGDMGENPIEGGGCSGSCSSCQGGCNTQH